MADKRLKGKDDLDDSELKNDEQNNLSEQDDEDVDWDKVDLSWLDEEDDINFGEIRFRQAMADYPTEVPLSTNEKKIGSFIIDFRSNEELKNVPEDKLENLSVVLDSMSGLVPLIKKYLPINLKIRDKYGIKLNYIWQLIEFGSKSSLPAYYPLGYFLSAKEDEIFELIETEGPIFLMMPVMQRKIEQWLSNKDTAGVKLNKMRDSLLEYGLGLTGKKDAYKMGRPEIELIRRLDHENLSYAHKSMTELFKIAKADRSLYKESIPEFIDVVGRKLLLSKKHEKKWLSEYKMYNRQKDLKFGRFISSTIEEDRELKRFFESFRWSPKELASEVMAKILEVSIGTLNKII